jgi:tetratricopeptide (TPR) repeat protein
MKNDPDQEKTLNVISEISDLLASLLTLKKSGKYQKAINMIDDSLMRHFDFDSSNMNFVSEDFLNEVYEQNQRISPDVTDSLANLLKEKGDLLYSQNRFEESRNTLNNALTIYFLLNDQQDFFSFERMNKMVLINETLSSIDLNISS